MKIWKIKKHCMSIKQAEQVNAHKHNWLNSFCNSPVHNGYLCMIHSGAPQRQNEVQLCSLKVAMCSWLWRSIVSVMFTVWPCVGPVFTREPWHVHYGVLLCSGTGVFTTQSWRAHCRVPLSLLWSLVFTAEAGVFTGIEPYHVHFRSQVELVMEPGVFTPYCGCVHCAVCFVHCGTLDCVQSRILTCSLLRRLVFTVKSSCGHSDVAVWPFRDSLTWTGLSTSAAALATENGNTYKRDLRICLFGVFPRSAMGYCGRRN